MPIDQRRVINNIYYLIKKRNMKIGEVETAVGVSAGYFSKLLKEDCNSLPSTEVLYKVSMMFDINMDMLLTEDMEQAENSTLTIMAFISKLIKDTDLNNIGWRKVTVDEYNSKEAIENSKISHLLYETIEVPYKSEIEYPDYIETIVHKSMFRKGTLLRPYDNCYFSDLPNGSNVYIMAVSEINNGLNDVNTIVKDIEMYIDTNVFSIEPVADLLYCDNSNIYEGIKHLYRKAAESSRHTRLSKNAMSAIECYLNGSNNLF